MDILGTIMVWMSFTLVSILPRLRQFPKVSSSLARSPTSIYFWKTVFIRWSEEVRGDTTMETGTRTPWFGLTRGPIVQSPKLHAVMLRSQHVAQLWSRKNRGRPVRKKLFEINAGKSKRHRNDSRILGSEGRRLHGDPQPRSVCSDLQERTQTGFVQRR